MTRSGSTRRLGAVAVAAVLIGSVGGTAPRSRSVEVLRPTGGLPAHVVGTFGRPLAFQRTPAGDSYVFDQRDHSVHRVSRNGDRVEAIVHVGEEAGRIIQPRAFDLEPRGTFVVADGPRQQERIQIFNGQGQRLGGFTLPGLNVPRVVVDGLVLSGVGALDYTGRSILVNQPERDALVTSYGLAGTAVRTFGLLRDTGFEANRAVHLGLNTGIPLAASTGGFYFVFRTGVPVFRKYAQSGALEFERHIEGRELDETIQHQSTTWPVGADGSIPLLPPVVRAAATDSKGNLWVALVRPFIYVYDPDGEKIRVVQLQAADRFSPDSLFFTADDRLLVTPGCYEFTVW